MVQRHSIPHFKPLIVDSLNPEGQGVWQHQELATPSSPKKYIFHKEWAWQANKKSHAPNLQDLRCLQSGLSNDIFLVFLLFLVLSKFDENQN